MILVLFPLFVFSQTSRGPFSWLVLNQLNLAYFRVLTLEMSKVFKTKSKRMRNCFRLFHIYEYNCKWRMKKWEKVKIWQNVFENWKCHLENFWRVSDMDIQIYLWQLWSSCITNPITEVDQENHIRWKWILRLLGK